LPCGIKSKPAQFHEYASTLIFHLLLHLTPNKPKKCEVKKVSEEEQNHAAEDLNEEIKFNAIN
jgi:hypothetical protein